MIPTKLLSRLGLLPWDNAVLLSDYEPSKEEMLRAWGGTPGWIALPDVPRFPLPGVRYCLLGNILEHAVQNGCRHAMMQLPIWQWRPRKLLDLHRGGLRWCWGPWGVLSTRALAWIRGGVILWRRFANQHLKRTSPDSLREFLRFLQQFPRIPVSSHGEKLRIVHYMRLCSMGGTEKQVALLAGEQKRFGQDVQVLAQMASLGESKTSHSWFDDAGITLKVAGCHRSKYQLPGNAHRLMQGLPAELRDTVLQLYAELAGQGVDVLHCWGDEPNIAGLIAAHLAGVRAVVQTSTGLSPHRYPAGLQDWMQPWYQVGLRQSHVAFACISEAGIADYADWLRCPRDRFRLLRIAVEADRIPTRQQGEQWRKQHEISETAPVVVGLFRLEPGKRPLAFLEVMAAVRTQVPDLQVLLIGGGSLEREVRRAIQHLGLSDVVRLLGQPAEVLTPLAAGDVMLLVSEAEGTPVSILEAQLAGCVPVVTDVGGCRETVIDGQSGFVVSVEDRDEQVKAVCRLLQYPQLRISMAQAGPQFVRQRFGLERMVSEAMQLYHSLLNPARKGVAAA